MSSEAEKQHHFERLVQNVVNKVAHVVVQSRVKEEEPSKASTSSSSATSSSASASASASPGSADKTDKENEWFNLLTPDNRAIKAALAPWKRHPSASAKSSSSPYASTSPLPPPSPAPSFSSLSSSNLSSVFASTGSYPTLHIQFYLTLPNAPVCYRVRKDPSELPKGQKVPPNQLYHQLELSREDLERLTTVVLEDWSLSFDHPMNPDVSIPSAYLNGVVFIRSLYTFTRLFPAHRLRSKLYKSNSPFKLGYRILSSSTEYKRVSTEQPLNSPILGWSFDTTSEQPLPGELQTLFGTFHVSVTYRNSCDFELLEKVNSLEHPFHEPILETIKSNDPILEGMEKRRRSKTLPLIPLEPNPPFTPTQPGLDSVKKTDEERSREVELQEPSFLQQQPQRPPSRDSRKFVEPHSLPKSFESTSPHFRVPYPFPKERSNSKPKIQPFKAPNEEMRSELPSSSPGNSGNIENFLYLMMSNPQMKIYEEIQPKRDEFRKDATQQSQPADDLLDQFRKMKKDFEDFSEDVTASFMRQTGTLKDSEQQGSSATSRGASPLNDSVPQRSPPSRSVPSSLTQQLKSPPILPQTQPAPFSFPSAPAASPPPPQPEEPESAKLVIPTPAQGIPIAAPKNSRPFDEWGLEETKKPVDLSKYGMFDSPPESDSDSFGSSSEDLFPIRERSSRARRGDHSHPLDGFGNGF